MRSRGVGWPRYAVHRFVLLLAGIAAMLLASPRSALGQTCRGDCDADLVVRVDELVLGVRIALGLEPRSLCEVLDTDQSLAVEVDELLGAVSTSFSGCPNTIRAHGMCLAPGSGGLEPCPAGTTVTAARCGLRRTCLGDPSSAIALGSARVAEDGSFVLVFDREEVGASILVFDARLDGRPYRAVSFDLRRPSAAGVEVGPIEVLIDPASEAGALLLAENGFEFFDDEGSLEVLAAVRNATAVLDFSGLASDAAVALAASTARDDTGVRQAIEERITPTPTPSATRTPTPTPTPPPPGRCNPGPLPTLPTASGATLRIGSAMGTPGSTVCIGAILQTAALPIVAFQAEVAFPPQAQIPPNGELAACAFASVFGDGAGFRYRPFGCTSGEDCTGVFVLAFNNSTVPDGSLAFTCEVAIAPDAAPGDYALPCSDALGSDRLGMEIDLGCVAGTVSVTGGGTKRDAG